MSSIKNTTINGSGKVVAGNDYSKNFTNNFIPPQTKLSKLFYELKKQFKKGQTTDDISEELEYYQTEKDVIGLEKKLINGDRSYLLDDANELKDLYVRKLYKYQLYDSAQKIHIFILSIICEKFRNLIYPLIFKDTDQAIISETISNKIIDPIMKIIIEEGCDDIMGLTTRDIDGMIYFLTGRCHIKWKL